MNLQPPLPTGQNGQLIPETGASRVCRSSTAAWMIQPVTCSRRMPKKRFRFRYDQRIGELVEKLVTTMPTAERQALQARHVYYPALTDEAVARRLGMSARGFDSVLLAATARFGRLWRENHRVAA